MWVSFMTFTKAKQNWHSRPKSFSSIFFMHLLEHFGYVKCLVFGFDKLLSLNWPSYGRSWIPLFTHLYSTTTSTFKKFMSISSLHPLLNFIAILKNHSENKTKKALKTWKEENKLWKMALRRTQHYKVYCGKNSMYFRYIYIFGIYIPPSLLCPLVILLYLDRLYWFQSFLRRRTKHLTGLQSSKH